MNRGIISTLAAVAGIGSLAVLSVPAHAGDLSWSGNVDDTTTVYLSGKDIHMDYSRKGVRDVDTHLQGMLPHHFTRVFLDDIQGRGSVQIVQQPSAENGYTAAVRIVDPRRGRDRYHFTLRWEHDDEFGGQVRYRYWDDRDDRDDGPRP